LQIADCRLQIGLLLVGASGVEAAAGGFDAGYEDGGEFVAFGRQVSRGTRVIEAPEELQPDLRFPQFL
jgi:hypothetical protein